MGWFGNNKRPPSDMDKAIDAFTEIARDIAKKVREDAEAEKKQKADQEK